MFPVRLNNLQLHVQILGQSNLTSISQGGQSVLKQPCSNTLSPPHHHHPSLKPCIHFPFFNLTMTLFHIPHHDISTQFNCMEGGQGIKEEEHWLKNNLFKNYYIQKKNGIPQRQAVWLTPVRGMINDSIFCLCCLLPLAAAAIYHHLLSAVESSSDSASQQTFSTRSRTTQGNYYCQNNNGLA